MLHETQTSLYQVNKEDQGKIHDVCTEESQIS